MSAAGPLAVCYGTRPQVIKASALIEALADRWELLTIDTGQHYDYALNALLYEQLGVRTPTVCLEVGSSDHATQTAAILTRAAEVMASRRPWAVVVIGDTNSTLGGALAAAKLRIPVVHVEAGLRAADVLMAEEINRRVTDSIAAVLCAPSATATQRLRAERPDGEVRMTGDIARDVLARQAPTAPAPGAGAGWPLAHGTPFIFATLHRAELVDHPRTLGAALEALARLDTPVVLAAHPRTRAAMRALALSARFAERVHVIPPVGYLEAIGCVRDAACVITDSGGVQREAYWLGTPCVTVRGETEWEETVGTGANVLVPPACTETLAAVVRERMSARPAWDRDAYGDGCAAQRVRDSIEWLEARAT